MSVVPERRAFTADLHGVTKGRRLQGYAAVFGIETRVQDYTESIAPGAFSMSLADGRDIVAMQDHDSSRVLARTKSGTLRLSQDDRGLLFDLDVPDTSAGRDLLELAERGDLGGCSFGFVPLDERWDGNHRELRNVDLKEISIVSAWPAYKGTTVQVRSRGVLFPRVATVRRYLDTL